MPSTTCITCSKWATSSSPACKDLGRYEWFEESCAAARQRVLDRDDSKEEIWRIQGSGKLEPLGLAYLRALWHWRDAEAKTWDRPSFMVPPTANFSNGAPNWPPEKTSPSPTISARIASNASAPPSPRSKRCPKSEWPERPNTKRRKRDRDFDRQVDALIKAREHAAANWTSKVP